jgi:DnaJ-class molecular chaperone
MNQESLERLLFQAAGAASATDDGQVLVGQPAKPHRAGPQRGRLRRGQGQKIQDILSEIFGRQGRTAQRRRGQDVRYHPTLSFLDTVNGGKQSIVLPDGTKLEVNIPPGTRDGRYCV